MINFIYKISYWVIFIILVFVAGITALSVLNFPGNFKIYTVQSGSMEPTIKTGSIVIAKPESRYSKGDIITFRTLGAQEATVTHRIVDVKMDVKKNIFFKTKGDANNSADSDLRSIKNVIGKVAFSLPYLGFPINFAKTLPGLLILIVIPVTIIVYSELLNIKNEATRLLRERKAKLSAKEKVEVAIGKEEIKIEKEIKNLFK
jgi:signal peptidase I